MTGEVKERPFVLLVETMPPKVRGFVAQAYPSVTGFVVEKTASEHDVEQLDDQFKTDGLLVSAYMSRSDSTLLFRVVDTNDNWSVVWYKVIGFSTFKPKVQ